IVIEKAMRPLATQFAIVGAADEGGVLTGHGRLVAEPIERPSLHLAFVHLAAVQHVMKRMQIMIPLRSDSADRGFEFRHLHRRLVAAKLSRFLSEADRVHRRTSMPSKLTSQPAASATLRASEFSSRIGLELLMWM